MLVCWFRGAGWTLLGYPSFYQDSTNFEFAKWWCSIGAESGQYTNPIVFPDDRDDLKQISIVHLVEMIKCIEYWPEGNNMQIGKWLLVSFHEFCTSLGRAVWTREKTIRLTCDSFKTHGNSFFVCYFPLVLIAQCTRAPLIKCKMNALLATGRFEWKWMRANLCAD